MSDQQSLPPNSTNPQFSEGTSVYDVNNERSTVPPATAESNTDGLITKGVDVVEQTPHTITQGVSVIEQTPHTDTQGVDVIEQMPDTISKGEDTIEPSAEGTV